MPRPPTSPNHPAHLPTVELYPHTAANLAEATDLAHDLWPDDAADHTHIDTAAAAISDYLEKLRRLARHGPRNP